MNPQAMAKHIQVWLIERLILWARNPRTHSDAQIAQIAASIAEFGFNNPILVDTKDGIIAGHGRRLAAYKLGLKEVPVIVLNHLSETQKRAYILADNKLAENAGWDEELLALELAALQDEDFNLDLIGFDDEGLARQHRYVRQLPILVVVVEPVADHEFIGDVEADEFDVDRMNPPAQLAQ